MEIFKQIPDIFFQFVITVLLTLLIGLEQRKLLLVKESSKSIFGTDRTFTFIGVLGFILYILDSNRLILFSIGAILLGLLMGIFYYSRIKSEGAYGITSIVVAFITYSLGPVIITQPRWLTILIVVSVLILVERKEYFKKFATNINIEEFITFAKFLIIAGVVLPILPGELVIPIINMPAHQAWFTVVLVSGISYFTYLLHTFVFKKSGIIVSGIFGGLYSSTATTLILSRKSKENNNAGQNYAEAIILATSMMYLRILLLVFIFNYQLGIYLLPYLLILFFVTAFSSILIHYIKGQKTVSNALEIESHPNPLELKVASIFAVLFIGFSFLTYYAINLYGNTGLNILSLIVGFTDIDPFLLNLFQGKYIIAIPFIAKAVLQATLSNNIMKAGITMFVSDEKTKKLSIIGFGIVVVVNLIMLFFI
jgi:uncharacterized membrane protein (DUF4010 family)